MKKKIIVSILFSFFLLLSMAGFAYSYFRVDINGDANDTLVSTGILRLNYIDSPEIVANNLYTNQYIHKKVAVANTGTYNTTYSVYLKDLVNTFENDEFVMSGTCTSYSHYEGEGSENNVVSGTCDNIEQTPANSKIVVRNEDINIGVIHVYDFAFWFLETGSNQWYNEGKTFSATINIFADEVPEEDIEWEELCDGTYNTLNCLAMTNSVVESDSELLFEFPRMENSTKDNSIKAKPMIVELPPENKMYYTSDLSKTEDSKVVYYYHGEVENNYVIFDDFCWRIVRINEDGSIRLIYGGEALGASPNQYCPRTGEASSIGTSKFNNSNTDNAYIGYMHGNTSNFIETTNTNPYEYRILHEIYAADNNNESNYFFVSNPFFNVLPKYSNLFNKSLSNINTINISSIYDQSSFVYFGSTYSYNNEDGKYYIDGNIMSGEWGTSEICSFGSCPVTNYYTCFLELPNAGCYTIYKINGLGSRFWNSSALVTSIGRSSASYAQAHANEVSSDIKSVIDEWYENNLLDSSSMIANAIYCNDRSITEPSTAVTNTGYGPHETEYAASGRIEEKSNGTDLSEDNYRKPQFLCPNDNDKFTLKVEKGGTLGFGNNALDYPIGLLTVDELIYSGVGSSYGSYLFTRDNSYYTMTPYNNSYVYYYDEDYHDIKFPENGYEHNMVLSIVPAISLKRNVFSFDGSGLYDDPYNVNQKNTFAINNNDSFTNDVNVSLSIYSYDAKTICISNSLTCTEYEEFIDTKSWILPSGEGEKTVYVFFKNEYGVLIDTISRTITVDTMPPINNVVSIDPGTSALRNLSISSEGAEFMCFSNISNVIEECSKWVNYSNSYSWYLTDELGTQTMFTFFKDSAGNISNAVSSHTEVTEIPPSFIEEFEDSTFVDNIIVNSTSEYPWVVNNGRFESSNQGIDSSTSVSTITFTPTTNNVLSFDYGKESHYSDIFRVSLSKTNLSNVSEERNISGDSRTIKYYVMANVTYTLTLTYTKDSSTSYYNDLAYIDNFKLEYIYSDNNPNFNPYTPTISFDSESNSTYSKSHSVIVNISDFAGLKDNQTLKYGWSTRYNVQPNSYTNVTLNNNFGDTSTSFTAINDEALSGEYYLWVVPVELKDIHGNENKYTTISSGKFLFDNEPPSCSIIATSSTDESIDAVISSEDIAAGIKDTNGYGFKYLEESNYVLSSNNNYSVSSLELGAYTIYGYVVDNADNYNTCSTTVVITNDVNILSIKVDNVDSSIPTSGRYYLTTKSKCTNGASIEWNNDNHSLIINDYTKTAACSVDLKSFLKLSEMPLGSYVEYVGNNGCPTTEITGSGEAKSADACSGKNANQNEETVNGVYGYCYNQSLKFTTYGWRLAYIDDSDDDDILEPYIVTAGSPECMNTNYEKKYNDEQDYTYISSRSIYYSNHYSFNTSTGKFILDGDMISGYWDSDNICTSSSCPILSSGYVYTCQKTTPTDECDTLYIIEDYDSDSYALTTEYTSSAVKTSLLTKLHTSAIKYCNNNYAYGNTCQKSYDESLTNAWALNDNDFFRITRQWYGVSKNLNNCMDFSEISRECGFKSDILFNGGKYWFANIYNDDYFYHSSTADNSVDYSSSSFTYGLRPVIHLKSDVYVLDGTGTMEDPYQIGVEIFNINNSEEYTDSMNVTLNLTSNFASTMCISNTNTCVNYEPFVSTKSWNLTSGDGTKTVYVKYKDENGNIISQFSDSIIYDGTAPTNNSISISSNSGRKRTLTLSSDGANYMCFSNTSNDPSLCTNWINYSTTSNWRLTSGLGTKTVYAFFKDNVGNISSAVSAITVVSIEYNVYEYFEDSILESELTLISVSDYAWEVNNGRLKNTFQPVSDFKSSSIISFTPTVDAMLSFNYGANLEYGEKCTIILIGSDLNKATLIDLMEQEESGLVNKSLSEGITYYLLLSYENSSSYYRGTCRIDNLVIE